MEFKIFNNEIECEPTQVNNCPRCRQKLLEKKLEETRLLFDFQSSIQLKIMMEELEKELEQIKKEKEKELFVYLCRKHQNSNSI